MYIEKGFGLGMAEARILRVRLSLLWLFAIPLTSLRLRILERMRVLG